MHPNTIKKIKDEPLQAAVYELHTIAQKQEKEVHNMEKLKHKVRSLSQRILQKLGKRSYWTKRKTDYRKRLLQRLYQKIAEEMTNAQSQHHKLISQHKSQYVKLKNKLEKLKRMLVDVPQLWLDFREPLMELEEQLKEYEKERVTKSKHTPKVVQEKRQSKQIYKMSPEVAELYRQMTVVGRNMKEKAELELPYELMSLKSTMKTEEKKRKQRRLKSKTRRKRVSQKKIIKKVANVDNAKKQATEHGKHEVTNFTKAFANEILRTSATNIKSQIMPKLLESKKVTKSLVDASRNSGQSVADIKKEIAVHSSKKSAKKLKQKKKAIDKAVKSKSKTTIDAVTKKNVKKCTSKRKSKQQKNKTVDKEISVKCVGRKTTRRQYCKRDCSIKKENNNADVLKNLDPTKTPEQLLKRKISTESILIKKTQLNGAGKSWLEKPAEEKHFSISPNPDVEVIFTAAKRKKSKLPWIKPADSIMLSKERLSQTKHQDKSRPSATDSEVLGNAVLGSHKKVTVNKEPSAIHSAARCSIKKSTRRSSKYSVAEKAPLGARIKITQSMLSYMSHSGILHYSKLPKRETNHLISMRNTFSKEKFMRKMKRIEKGSLPKPKPAPRIGSESAKNLIESLLPTSSSQPTSEPDSYRETRQLKPTPSPTPSTMPSSMHTTLTKISRTKLENIKKSLHDITGFKFEKVVKPKKQNKEPAETPPAVELEEGQLDSGFLKIQDSDLDTYKRVYNLLMRQQTPTEEEDLNLLDDYARNPTKYNYMLQKLYDMRVMFSETSYDRNLIETEFSSSMQKLSARQRQLRLRRTSSLGSTPSFHSLLVQNAMPSSLNFAAEAMQQKWSDFFAEQSVTPTKLLEQKQKQEQELKRLREERRRLQLEARELLRRNQHFGPHVRQHDNPRKTNREQRALAMISDEKKLEKPSMKKHVCEICGMSDCSDSESEPEDCQTNIAATHKIIDQFKHLRLHL